MAGSYVTDEEMYQAPKDGQKYERVDGEMRVGPGGGCHSAVTVNVGARLGLFVGQRKLGYVVGSRTGYLWPGRHADRPDNVRSPDVSFVSVGRFPDERLPDGFPELARTWQSRCCIPTTAAATCSRESVSTSTWARGWSG